MPGRPCGTWVMTCWPPRCHDWRCTPKVSACRFRTPAATCGSGSPASWSAGAHHRAGYGHDHVAAPGSRAGGRPRAEPGLGRQLTGGQNGPRWRSSVPCSPAGRGRGHDRGDAESPTPSAEVVRSAGTGHGRRGGGRTHRPVLVLGQPRIGLSRRLWTAEGSRSGVSTVIHFSTATPIHSCVAVDQLVYLNHPQAYTQDVNLAGPGLA